MSAPALSDGPPLHLPNADHARPTRIGLWLLVLGFGGFLLWAALAPLDEGVPTPGMVGVETKRKRVEHLTGGLVERILVKEGEHVAAGQDLVVLNQVQGKAALDAVRSQWIAAAATVARLVIDPGVGSSTCGYCGDGMSFSSVYFTPCWAGR